MDSGIIINIFVTYGSNITKNDFVAVVKACQTATVRVSRQSPAVIQGEGEREK